jgi:hypothetical protein
MAAKNNKYRFFYHFYKQKGKMSVHFRNQCTVVDNIICAVPCETKWKPTQPRLVMQGFATSVEIRNNNAYIQ